MRISALSVAMVAGVVLGTMPGVAAAQNDSAVTTMSAPTWSSPEIARIASMLAGSWRTAESVAQADGAGQVEIVMTIAPVTIEGVADALYVEAARADALFEPYRQAIFQLYTYKQGVRLRTYELRNDPGIKNAIVGMAYAPDLMPQISRDQLFATLDLDLTSSGSGVKGKTPYPYPTGAGGAVEMVSEIELTPERLVSIDRGMGADGSIVWGSEEGGRYEFVRFESQVSVTRTPEGVTAIKLLEGAGETMAEGQLVTVHYTGYTDDGRSFDSSRARPQPFTFRWPGELIPGWNIGVTGMREGERRRVIIPGAQGYGERGNPAAGIAPNARLIFDLECMKIQPQASMAPAEPAAGGH
jgi:hypothetical protein